MRYRCKSEYFYCYFFMYTIDLERTIQYITLLSTVCCLLNVMLLHYIHRWKAIDWSSLQIALRYQLRYKKEISSKLKNWSSMLNACISKSFIRNNRTILRIESGQRFKSNLMTYFGKYSSRTSLIVYINWKNITNFECYISNSKLCQ